MATERSQDFVQHLPESLPDDWHCRRLDTLVSFTNGLWKGERQPLRKARVLRNTNFNNDGILDYSDIAELEVQNNQFVTRQLAPGDIILERSGGGPSQPVGRVVIFERNEDDFSFSNFTTRIRVLNQDEVQPKCLLYYLLHFYQAGYTDSLQKRTTGIRNLMFADYKGIVIPLPSLAEQRRIAAVLNTIQEAIAAQEDVIAAAKAFKRSLMHRLFTYGPGAEPAPTKEAEVGEIPAHWELRPVGALCRSIVPGRDKPKSFTGTIPWITIPDIRDRAKVTHSLAGLALTSKEVAEVRAKVIPMNAVVMSCVGEFGLATVTGTELVINQQLHAFVCPDELEPQFLASALSMRKTYMGTIAHATTVAYLNKAKCESIPIPLPPVSEQEQIVEMLSAANAKVAAEEDRLTALQALFKSMLHQLVTGQIRLLSDEGLPLGGVG